MKTNVFFRIALATTMLVSASNFMSAQRHQTDSRNNSNNTSRDRQYTQTSREQRTGRDDHREQTDKSRHYGEQKYSPNSSRHTPGNHYGWDKQKNNRHYDSHEHRDWNSRHKHNDYGHYKHHAHHRDHVVYYHRLPAERYNRYVVNGLDYYHCDGRFFRLHANYGFVQVDCPYMMVNVLPHSYHVRYVNGQQMIFWRGYYYLPVAHGWMMVPEPASPQFSLNIHIGR